MDALVELFGLSKRPKVPKDLILGDWPTQHQGDPLMPALKPTYSSSADSHEGIRLALSPAWLDVYSHEPYPLDAVGSTVDYETVPDWVYEVTKKVHEDDDLYKARIFLSMSPVLEDEEKEEVESVVSELSEYSMDEDDKAALEKMNADREEAEKKEEEERSRTRRRPRS